MKTLYSTIFISAFWMISCNSEVSKEKRPLVESINKKVDDIDANHRVNIVEDDFHKGDSIYKIRGYFMDGNIQKLVGVLYSTDGERDDYFYFEDNNIIFSGHIVVHKDIQEASEYKFYYDQEGKVAEALYWKDTYERGKQFPHEKFQEFEPNSDSLHIAESERLNFFITKLDAEGFGVLEENENLGANRKDK